MARTQSIDERASQAKFMARKRADLRDIAIDFSRQNMRRRRRGEQHPEYFLKKYFPHIFYLKMSPNQKHNIKELAVRMRFGGQKAIADKRGGGKTSIAKGMVIWGMVYGVIHWVPWIESNLELAKDSLEDIKLMFEDPIGDDLFGADFPEYCVPLRELKGQTQRANTQTFKMKRTKSKWGQGRIIMPTIASEDTPHKTPALGGIIQPFGADKAIRGLVRSGRRPDFVLINDIETEETAKSPTMTENIRRNIVNAVMGLGGPGQKIGISMLCTIIRKGCVADMFTDRKQYPQWNGERMKMLYKEPVNRDLWDKYIYMRRKEQRAGVNPPRQADAFYRKHRKIMDRGAKIDNPLIFEAGLAGDGKPKELSAIQHYYNLLCDRGEEYVLCECQNEPPDEMSMTTAEIEQHVIEDKLNGSKRGDIPAWSECVTGFVDVHADKLYWSLVAWRQGATGYVVDYGVDRVLSPMAGTVTKEERSEQTELAIVTALNSLQARWDERYEPDLVLIDAGWKDIAVYNFTTGKGKYRPAKGGSGRTGAYSAPKPSKTIRDVGNGYHLSWLPEKRIWLMIHDATKWKLRAQDGFLTNDPEANGSLSLWGDEPMQHRAFAEQIVAEAYNIEKRAFDPRKGFHHNHWLDCIAGCCVAAARLGIRLMPAGTPSVTPKPRTKAKRGGYLDGVTL